MGNPKGLLQVLWERLFMDTSKYVCNYYRLCGREDNYGNTIIEMSLRELIWNCLKFIDKEELLQTNDFNMGGCRDHILIDLTPIAPLSLLLKALSTPEVLQIIITDEYHWIRIEVRKIQKNCPRGHIKRKPYHKSGFYVLYTCMGVYH